MNRLFRDGEKIGQEEHNFIRPLIVIGMHVGGN